MSDPNDYLTPPPPDERSISVWEIDDLLDSIQQTSFSQGASNEIRNLLAGARARLREVRGRPAL